ncbi:MAG: B12-binding domain-containing protein, partial [Bacteroidales bacterium]|nr:B12-binding domain-containing protein [Bacteroidales bacterium]
MNTEDLLIGIANCVERGKVNKTSPFPPDLKNQDGADELTAKALEQGITADQVLQKGLVPGMEIVGVKFRENRV